MMKLRRLLALAAICAVPSEAVVRGLKHYDNTETDLTSWRRNLMQSRKTLQSFFGPEETNHIGTPGGAASLNAFSFAEELSPSPTPLKTTLLTPPVPSPLPPIAPAPDLLIPDVPSQSSWSGDTGGSWSGSGMGKGSGGSPPTFYSSGSGSSSFSSSGSAPKSKASKGASKKKGKGKGESKGGVKGKRSGKGGGSKSKAAKQPKKKDDDKKNGSSKKNIGSKMGKISKGKGKGKGLTRPPFGPPTPSGPPVPTSPQPTRAPVVGVCSSAQSDYVLSRVPEAIARNPNRCCDYDGPVFSIITHALPDRNTDSGFESFWNAIYVDIDEAATKRGLCFFMTGVDPAVDSGRNVSEILINVNEVVSGISSVSAIMTTDPTDTPDLMKSVRSIFDNPGLPSIGVFNSGYDNVVVESLLTGEDRLPYVGSTTEDSYGKLAATATLRALNNVPPVAICLSDGHNATAIKCKDFYSGLKASPPGNKSDEGAICSSETTDAEILSLVAATNANVLWAHQDCCEAAAAASNNSTGRILVVGCMDVDPVDYRLDFITTQPTRLQAQATSSWASFPVIQELKGRDGREPQYFPSLKSLIRTAIQNVMPL